MKHDAQHEQLLEQLFTEWVDPQSKEIRQLLDSCQDCQRIMKELSPLHEGLSSLGDQDRELIAEALADSRTEDYEKSQRWLEDRLGERPVPSSSRLVSRAVVGVVLAAAAALLLLVLNPFGSEERSDWDPNRQLGQERLRCLEPIAEADGGHALVFEDSDSYPGVRYKIEIELEGGETIESPRLDQQRWELDAQTWASLPLNFEWTVSSYDPGGELLATGKGQGSREP